MSASPSSVLTQGFGAWGTPSLVVCTGFGTNAQSGAKVFDFSPFFAGLFASIIAVSLFAPRSPL